METCFILRILAKIYLANPLVQNFSFFLVVVFIKNAMMIPLHIKHFVYALYHFLAMTS